LAGVKLILAIAALVLILVLVFGKPLTGFSVLSFVGFDSLTNNGDSTTGKIDFNSPTYTKNNAVLEGVLDKSPVLASGFSKLTYLEKRNLDEILANEQNLSEEMIEKILNHMLQTPEALAEIEEWGEEARRTGPTAVGGYEESFVIGGNTYTEDELKNMSTEQIEALTGQTQGGGMDK